MEKELIVGIDPGTSVGISAIDLNGELVDVYSARNIGIDETVLKIASWGMPVVLATDKKEIPAYVSKLGSILGVQVFSPAEDLLVEKKRELAGNLTTNDHERDSLAAAIYAFNNFQNKMRRVEKQIECELEKTKARVLNGEEVSDIFERTEDSASKDRTCELEAQIKSLQKKIRELEAENLRLQRKNKGPDVKRILREAGREARELMRLVAKGKLAIVKEVPSLEYFEIKNAIEPKTGDFVFARSKKWDGNGLRFLESRRVGAIISQEKIDSLMPNCVADDINIIRWEGLFFVYPDDIKKACGRKKEVNARDLHDLLVDYKKGRR